MKLLREKQHINIFQFLIGCLYIAYFIMMHYVKEYTLEQFDLLPEDQKKLDYPKYYYEDAELYNYELPPLQINNQNILEFWDDGNQLFKGLKLSLLLPAIIHVYYYMLTRVNPSVNAFCNYKKSDLNRAQYILIKFSVKVGLNKELKQTVMLPVYHYYFEGSYHQQITYENEIYLLKQEGKELKLIPKYQEQQYTFDISQAEQSLTQQEVYQKQAQYGLNQIKVKYPQFLQIAKEELLTPYFAFQIITTILYALDNYGSYSLMNFAILLFSQSSNIYQKYISLRNTVKLAPKTCLVTVIRDGKEQVISSKELVPGDHVIYRKEQYDKVIEIDDKEQEEPEQQNRKPTQLEILKQQAVYKMIFRIYDLIFAKYYDQSIIIPNDKEQFSLIFPADMILVKGQLISDESNLTGEQASQIKEAVQSNELQHHNLVFAGTQMIQLQDQECHFIVKTTRCDTEQGQLIKQIIFGDDRMKTQSSDSTIFLILMCMCALCSSVYTFVRGYKNHITNLSNLIIECLLIFVQIIPPDLPSQLSMVITDSIAALREKKIFSTDPYKLLNAGRCQCVCFDKSGTLTQQNLQILGIDDQLTDNSYRQIQNALQTTLQQPTLQKTLQPTIQTSKEAKLIISGCNSVTKLNDQLLGDLLEINSIKTLLQDFQIQENQISFQSGKTQILKRFYFNSNLKRMTCIVSQNSQQFTVIKGSPEIVFSLLKQKPQKYFDVLNKYTKNGYRVITLAYKYSSYSNFDKLKREDVEGDFIFAGFLICRTPLKSETKESILKLKKANVNVKVISGDYIVNVVVSSTEAGICDQKKSIRVIKDVNEEKQTALLSDLEGQNEKSVKIDDIDDMQKQYTICVNGSTVDKLIQGQHSKKLINYITIFARTTPKQKSDIIQCLQKTWATVYVGDGVNDLTALKVSDVGVALLSEVNDKQAQKQAQKDAKKIPYPRIMQQPGNRPASYQQLIEAADRLSRQKNTPINYELQQLIREQQQYKQYLAMQKMNKMGTSFYSILNAFEAEDDLEDNATQTATIAASFSSKVSQISSVIEIIRQGSSCVDKARFNYIQNALNSIIGAYSMTVMTLNGVRSNNSQQIAVGMLFTVISLLFTRLKPIEDIKISKKQQNIVDLPFIISTILQSAIHISVLFLIQKQCVSVMETVPFSTSFSPSILNTCVFYIQIIQDFTVIMANFTHLRLQRNRTFVLCLAAYILIYLCLLFEIQPEINEQLGLVLLSQDLKMKVFALSAFDLIGSVLVEQVFNK